MKKLLLSIAFLLPAMGMMAQTQVTTAEGILEGKDLSGLTVFKGVPFAAPPVGNLRWKAPQPVQKWQGVRMAKEFGANPMQEPIFGDMNFGTKNNSEDCLLPEYMDSRQADEGASAGIDLFQWWRIDVCYRYAELGGAYQDEKNECGLSGQYARFHRVQNIRWK